MLQVEFMALPRNARCLQRIRAQFFPAAHRRQRGDGGKLLAIQLFALKGDFPTSLHQFSTSGRL